MERKAGEAQASGNRAQWATLVGTGGWLEWQEKLRKPRPHSRGFTGEQRLCQALHPRPFMLPSGKGSGHVLKVWVKSNVISHLAEEISA